MSGSGPTVLGLFPATTEGEGPWLAERAAARLGGRTPAALSASPVQAGFGEVETGRRAGPAPPLRGRWTGPPHTGDSRVRHNPPMGSADTTTT